MVIIYYYIYCDITYSSSYNLTPPISRVLIGQHLIFCSLASPACCNSPRKCTPVKYKMRQLSHRQPHKLRKFDKMADKKDKLNEEKQKRLTELIKKVSKKEFFEQGKNISNLISENVSIIKKLKKRYPS